MKPTSTTKWIKRWGFLTIFITATFFVLQIQDVSALGPDSYSTEYFKLYEAWCKPTPKIPCCSQYCAYGACTKTKLWDSAYTACSPQRQAYLSCMKTALPSVKNPTSRFTPPTADSLGSKQSYCSDYASLAVNQNRKNIRQQCNYTGNRWRNDFNHHYDWCKKVNRDSSRSENQARVNDLSRCLSTGPSIKSPTSRFTPPTGDSLGSKQSYCSDYASLAVNQNRKNIRQQCNYTGSRWRNDFNHHYDWCKKVSRDSSRSENHARVDSLNHCRPTGQVVR